MSGGTSSRKYLFRTMGSHHNLSLCTFNCRSSKSSVDEIRQLCNNYDIVMLQEHWLLPNELNILSSIHPEFFAIAQSAVDISQDILVGRPYGGTAILYKKQLASIMSVVNTFEPRICAINILTSVGPTLFVCVYMPCDQGDADSVENYTSVCSKITALYAECDAVNLVIAGDFNCDVGYRVFNILQHFMDDNKLIWSDAIRMSNVFTYFNDAGTNFSWIDHIMCSKSADELINSSGISVLSDYVSSDHKPLIVHFDNILVTHCSSSDNNISRCKQSNRVIPDWSKADQKALCCFQESLHSILSNIDIPACLFDVELAVPREDACSLIECYYEAVMNGITTAANASLPSKVYNVESDSILPGWNDYAQEKHSAARDAFLEWVAAGKIRQGPEFMRMKLTRAQFKLAVRFCKQHEDRLRADAYAKSLMEKDYSKFWYSIRKSNNVKCTKFANTINGCTGDNEIADMWMSHYKDLYNSVNDSESKFDFYQRVDLLRNDSMSCLNTISVRDVVNACDSQKSGKAVGNDGIAMEAFLFGGLRLHVHITLLFNLFIRYCYLPRRLMVSVIIPLVKCKTGDLSTVDNYRAIAVSTAVSKLFENVVFRFVKSFNYFDAYQFGFKAGHSTSLCTSVLKQTVDYYTQRGSHVFACFIDFTKAFDKVNYWRLFNKLLDDGCDINIVSLLAFWFSNQVACVRWHNSQSDFFHLGNGTRQGGVLSPLFFARYIRELLKEIVTAGIGCNVGGLPINVLAYADDIVLLAPSWRGLQRLLDIVHAQITLIDMVVNSVKTVCMVFNPRNRSNYIADSFPLLQIGSSLLLYVHCFKYLGHRISEHNSDDDDIQREISSLFVRTNILLRRFASCSLLVKSILFKSFCICMYDVALWKKFTAAKIQKFRSCYNRCIKLFFGFKRRDSLTQVLLVTGLPSFDTVRINAEFSFNHQWSKCHNFVVVHLRSLQY